MKDQLVWRREGSDFLYVREEIMQFCEFDQYPALFLSCLIGWHTHTVNDNLRKGEPDEKPWIIISKNRLRQSSLGLVSFRKMDDSVDFLCAKRILSVREPVAVGDGRAYFLDVDRLNALLKALPPLDEFPGPGEVPARKNGWVAQRESVGMDAESVGMDAERPSAWMPSVSINKDLLKDPSQDSSPTPSGIEIQIQDLDLEDGILVFAPNAYRRSRRPRLKLGRKTDVLTTQKLEDQENKHGAVLYRSCLLNYLADESQWLRENGWPLARFFQNPESYAPSTPPTEPPREPEQAHEPKKAKRHQRVEPDAPQAISEKITLPDRWNQLVPAMPVDWDWKRSNVDGLRMCELDDVFVAKFDDICERAQKIHVARSAEYLTFNWIIKRSSRSGPWNWFKLLQDFGWMEKPDPKEKSTGRTPWVPGQKPPQGIWNDEDEATYKVWRDERIAAGQHYDPDQFFEEESRAAGKGAK